MGPSVVEIHAIDFPKLALGNRKCEHGVILKIAVATNILWWKRPAHGQGKNDRS